MVAQQLTAPFHIVRIEFRSGRSLSSAHPEFPHAFLPDITRRGSIPTPELPGSVRGTGDFKPGMVVQTGSLVINMLLAPFLIFGRVSRRPLGVAGAALASLIAIVIGSVWLWLWFLSEDAYLKFRLAYWRPQFRLWSRMLKIGLPAGAEFALMAVYLFVIYTVIRPFGSAVQAGFGIGLRVVQAGFMPVVALGFAVAPVAGQNFGARKPDRVSDTFRSAVWMGSGLMLLSTGLAHLAPAAMVDVFSPDPQVTGVGQDHLRIVSWNFVASGIVFISSSKFQAMGNTIPSLVTSFTRSLVVAVPAFVLAKLPGFQMRWLWCLSVASVTLQMTMNLLLLRREFKLRLGQATAAAEETRRPRAGDRAPDAAPDAA